MPDLWVITACGVVSTVGLSGDIARHLRTGTSITGDFWASWHLVLYAGVTGLAAWLGWTAIRQGITPTWRTWPSAVAGLLVLGAGGIGDWIWHTVFGVEVQIAALVSPPHLLLLAGLVLVLLAPTANLWRSRSTRLSVDAVVVGIGITAVISVVMLFTGYLSLFSSDVVVEGFTNPMVGTQPLSTEVIHGIATVLWTSSALTGPWLLLQLRWTVPIGLIAGSFATLAIATALTVEGIADEAVSATLIAGLVIDGSLAVLTRGWSTATSLLATAVTIPLVLWTFVFLALELSDRLEWDATLTVGSTALATMLTSTLAAALLLARRSPQRDELRRSGRP